MKAIGKCKVEGCERPKKSLQMCEMHYYRVRRYGTTERTRTGKHKERLRHSNGYVLVYDPGHPLAQETTGRVYEHRAAAWNKYGENLPPCQICGVELSWESCHIDHIDNVKDNNDPDNLRPTCSPCNRSRPIKERTYVFPHAKYLTVNGITLTVADWSRRPDVNVSAGAIHHRLNRGFDPYSAVYGPKKTHNGNKAYLARKSNTAR